MGTDIHIVAQVRNNEGIWEDIPTDGYDIDQRRYSWFTFLDGTRDRGEGIIPISKPRGRPEGFSITEPDNPYDFDTYHNDTWMGYGVSSHVTLAEILEHEKKQPALLYRDRIGPIEELERLFAGHKPENCRIVFGYDS